MAFLQSEIPPSTAPVGAMARAAVAPPVVPVVRDAPIARPRSYRLAIRLSAVLAGAALLFIPGYAAAQATESAAMGILAADFIFLIGIAGWSSIAGDSRR